ncbi:MAG: hypothetical protein ABIR26_09650 [Ramlibacter sp.]
MLVSQKIAIAAHLHVLLRRKTGRVTDTEWMAGNLEYALEIVRFARAKALEDGHADLAEWADKLEKAVLEPSPAQRVPLVQTAAQMLRDRSQAAAAAPAPNVPAAAPNPAGSFGASTFGESGFAESTLEGEKRKPREPDVPRYVGGIR